MRIILMAVLVLLLASCSSDGAQAKKMTVAEYAQAACFEEDLADNATWGDFANLLEGAVKTYKEVNPPAKLQEYHDAANALAKAAHEVARDKPQGQVMNAFEMMEEADLMVLGMTVGTIQEGLSPEDQRILEAAGCD